MPLHLIKLAVGCESVKELRNWVPDRMQTAKKKRLPLHHIHVTRMTPKRIDEILAGGSLYWVIRGEIAAREKIIAVEPFRDRDGIGRCRLVMQPKVGAVMPRPMRPFQGWRYFAAGRGSPGLKSPRAGPASAPDIIDQPGLAKLGRHQNACRAVLERGDRRQRVGVPGLEIVQDKSGVGDQRGAAFHRSLDVVAGVQALGGLLDGAVQRRRRLPFLRRQI